MASGTSTAVDLYVKRGAGVSLTDYDVHLVLVSRRGSSDAVIDTGFGDVRR